ncbi:MAG: hypothetical protein JSV88_33380 [Candidatus Aminicenantes bacterium]|nr:MAG: hypothetical protein JSV88_33380 [Candidatus Aminicenantes bacterium]
MIINKKKALEDFENIIELPVLGKALYFRILELKDAIAANIEQYKNIMELRNMVKKKTKNWPKSSNDIEFEIVNIKGNLWVPVIPGQKGCEPSKIIPLKLVDYIVKKSFEMTPGLIERNSNLIVPGIKGKVFDIWFEKIRDDYIHGIIKSTLYESSISYNVDIEKELKDLKNIDFDELFAVFRLIFESNDFMKQVIREYRKIWKSLIEDDSK